MADSTTPLEPLEQPFPIRIRAVTTLRVTNLIGSLVIAAVGAFGVWGGFQVGLITHNGWIISAIGLPFALYGLALAPGTQRLGVVVNRDDILVRGYLRTQRIPRGAIREITSYPSIVWIDERGRQHTTLLNVFNVYRSGRASPNPRLLARVEQDVDVIRKWAAGAAQ